MQSGVVHAVGRGACSRAWCMQSGVVHAVGCGACSGACSRVWCMQSCMQSGVVHAVGRDACSQVWCMRSCIQSSVVYAVGRGACACSRAWCGAAWRGMARQNNGNATEWRTSIQITPLLHATTSHRLHSAPARRSSCLRVGGRRGRRPARAAAPVVEDSRPLAAHAAGEPAASG